MLGGWSSRIIEMHGVPLPSHDEFCKGKSKALGKVLITAAWVLMVLFEEKNSGYSEPVC